MVLKFSDTTSSKVTHSEQERKKIRERRATKAVLPTEMEMAQKASGKKKIKVFRAAPKWWQKPSIKYAFSHPYVTSRLEKLMGSNLVQLTDREYMQKLQERILEDYAESMDKRIKVREKEEMERVKNLVLSGRIPLNQAPPSMADHPIMMIEKYCQKLIAQRRAKIKIPKVHIPTHLYYDDTPDPPSGLSIEKGHVFRSSSERLCNPVSRFLPPNSNRCCMSEMEGEGEEEGTEEEGEENEEMIMDEYMFTPEEYERLKYESPLIKELRMCETVEELYILADQIIGVLKTVDETRAAPDRSSIASSIAPSIATSTAPSQTPSQTPSQGGSSQPAPDSVSQTEQTL